MKIKELIRELTEVEKINPEATVYITANAKVFDFSGFSCDDKNNVQLFVSCSDGKA